MDFNFLFRMLQDAKDLNRLEQFTLRQNLGYPNYADWVSRTIRELKDTYKQAILAFSDEYLVADLIFQPHKDFPNHILELKNLRIHEKLQGRYFGSYMLKQVEVEARKVGYKAIIGDTRSDNLPIISLLKFCGYQELVRAPLYDSNVEDMIFVKSLTNMSEFFKPLKIKIISKAA